MTLDVNRSWDNSMLIDAHAHLDKYDDPITAVLDQVRMHRIVTISTSVDLASYRRNLEIAEQCELVIPTFGIHPWNAPTHAELLDDLAEAVDQTAMIGEIGLDHHFVEDVSAYAAQREVFEFFLQEARRSHKIVNLHTKGAEAEVAELLQRHSIERAIVHWYSGPLEVFRELVDQRRYFTIGVEVLYSEHIRRIASGVPADLLLTETDNPGGMKWLTGEAGQPRILTEVIATLADLRNTTARETVHTIRTNFLRLIDGDPWVSQYHENILQSLRCDDV
jgi:TatD DNase family protein